MKCSETRFTAELPLSSFFLAIQNTDSASFRIKMLYKVYHFVLKIFLSRSWPGFVHHSPNIATTRLAIPIPMPTPRFILSLSLSPVLPPVAVAVADVRVLVMEELEELEELINDELAGSNYDHKWTATHGVPPVILKISI